MRPVARSSYARHEYFRRLLCNILERDMRRGLIPDDPALVGGLVADVCYRDASAFFGFTRSYGSGK